MDRKKKSISSADLSKLMRMWLLIIPMIVAIIGSATLTSMWLASRSDSSTTIHSRITDIDKDLLNNIGRDFRNTYLQFLRVKINPGSDPERVEQLDERLTELMFQEREIIQKYDPFYATERPSTMEILFEIIAEVPYPIVFTIAVVVGIFLFLITRYLALFIIMRRYTPSYVKEV
ncbi:hypothetical protein [Nitrosococcus oceani]|uniref:hypothetical protein n=1 Tax=Nitrosococcus oceani TaxID=1229 RepID=UPI0004E8BE08|nr:hypothetical protein [Nitrosococcus oceani]KFI22462.1 hypothetical protein HW44_09140 [Nitrosococcus oceani]